MGIEDHQTGSGTASAQSEEEFGGSSSPSSNLRIQALRTLTACSRRTAVGCCAKSGEGCGVVCACIGHLLECGGEAGGSGTHVRGNQSARRGE